MPFAPTRERGFNVLWVPLQRSPALSAAPPAVMFSRLKNPPHTKSAERFAAHAQSGASISSADPGPLTGRCCGNGVHQPLLASDWDFLHSLYGTNCPLIGLPPTPKNGLTISVMSAK